MNKILLAFAIVCFLPVLSHAQCAPFMGVGSVQFLDNTAKPLTSGVVYFYQAGTSTQQATFTSSTCGTVNTNPLSLGVGGRAQIWLTSSSLYKVVLCAQNDGPACSAGDVLFSVDQVPGGSSGGGGGGGSPFIGVFISGSSSPATSGAVRLASGDLACFRNSANSGNLCISKDSNDLLTWQGGSIKLPESNTPTSIPGFGILEADINAHRIFQCSNGVTCTQIVNAGVDINTSDQVIGLHFGSTAQPLSTTAPTANQDLTWDGAHISGVYRGSIGGVNAQSGTSYTLALTDAGGWVRMTSGSANSVTVPTNASVAFPVNTIISVRQSAAGQTTIVAAGGVTIQATTATVLRTQGSTISLIKIGSDTWDLVGDLQ